MGRAGRGVDAGWSSARRLAGRCRSGLRGVCGACARRCRGGASRDQARHGRVWLPVLTGTSRPVKLSRVLSPLPTEQTQGAEPAVLQAAPTATQSGSRNVRSGRDPMAPGRVDCILGQRCLGAFTGTGRPAALAAHRNVVTRCSTGRAPCEQASFEPRHSRQDRQNGRRHTWRPAYAMSESLRATGVG